MSEIGVPIAEIKDISKDNQSGGEFINPNKRIDVSRTMGSSENIEVNPNDRCEVGKQESIRRPPVLNPNERINEASSTPDNKNEKTDNKTNTDTANNRETESEKNSYEIHTRNESLEGDRHPITGVPFERKTVKDADGNDVTGVFPVFDSEFDAQLPEDLYQSTDKEQFTECNKQLKEAIENDPELAKKFTPEQLEQIMNGDTPDGYTWHHNEETGKMQLVDSDTHAKTGHTGGKTIWGGGNENR